MGMIIFGFIVVIICCSVSVACFSGKSKGDSLPGLGTFFLLVAIALVGILVFCGAPRELGYSHVSGTAEDYTKRLETGVVYKTLFSSEVHKTGIFEPDKKKLERIILVVKEGGDDYLAMRIGENVAPPERFTLINGRPVALK